MSPAAQKFYYLQVNISKPNGRVRGVGSVEREGKQINDKWVYIMPKSAACNINGQEGERIQHICLCVCVRARWSGVLRCTWLRDFYSCHTPCLWGGTGLVPKQRIGCSCIRSLTAGSEAPTGYVKCLLQTSPTRLHAHSTRNTFFCLVAPQVSFLTGFSLIKWMIKWFTASAVKLELLGWD